MHDTCITHEIRRRHAQSNLKVTPKCNKSYFHMLKVAPKWPQSDPKRTPMFYKIIKIYWKNECFLKIYPHTPKVTPQWSQSNQKVMQSHRNMPKVTPKWLQSDPRVVFLGSFFALLGSPGPLWHLQKCFKNQYFFNFSRFRPHQARTCMHDTCITHEIRRRHAQSNLKVTPKCPKSYFHMPKMVPKWLPSNPEVTLELYKIIKIYWENECFLKSDLITSKVTPQWSQSNHKVTQSHPNIPRVTPKWPQSGPKVARAAQPFVFWISSWISWPLQKCFKNQ